jgi:hypothetical protein
LQALINQTIANNDTQEIICFYGDSRECAVCVGTGHGHTGDSGGV